jgi:soluble cytochrome b562
MSSISSLSATTSADPTANQNTMSQLVQSFKAVSSALQSGDLSSAQSAFPTFQQALQGNSSTASARPFGKNSQANTDYQSLTSSLQSGNLAAAQKAFTSLKNDLQSTSAGGTTQSAHKSHHHHHAASATSSSTSATTTPATTASNNQTNGSFSTVGSDGSLNVTA